MWICSGVLLYCRIALKIYYYYLFIIIINALLYIIVVGELDDIPEMAFYMVGNIADVYAAAEKLAK